MKTKMQGFKLESDAAEALEAEALRTGKTKTAVIEDLLLFRRLFGDDVERIIQGLASQHHLPARRVVETCVLKAAGSGGQLPFSWLALAH